MILEYKYRIGIVYDAIVRPKRLRARVMDLKARHIEETLRLQRNFREKLGWLSTLTKPSKGIVSRNLKNPIVSFPMWNEDIKPYEITNASVITVEHRKVLKVQMPLLEGYPIDAFKQEVVRELARKLMNEGYLGFETGRYNRLPTFYINTIDL